MLPKLLRFIVPLTASSLLQLAFNAADLIVVGRFGRPNALAAVGSNVALVNLVVNTFMGLAVGGLTAAAMKPKKRSMKSAFGRTLKTMGEVVDTISETMGW